MALDQLTLLINRYRRLSEGNENGENDDKIDEIRSEIADLLSESDEKVIIKGSYEKEICMRDLCLEDYHGWVIDDLVEDRLSQKEILARDIDNNPEYYINLDNMTITIEDENGNKFN